MPRRPVPDLRVGALRAAYDTGGLSPADVVDEVLGRIAARGDDHVWITLVAADDLRARAAALAGRGDRPPLYGVPFAVKDNIDVAGLPTTAGLPGLRLPPDRTAPVRRAGCSTPARSLVGKTNLDQFATGLTGTRSPYGALRERLRRRPDLRRVELRVSAVAVAAGSVAFALGTDTAGSGRVPAALNGIVGLKPTRGLRQHRRRACRPAARSTASRSSPATSPTPPPCSRCWPGPTRTTRGRRAARTGAGAHRPTLRLGARRTALDFAGDAGQAAAVRRGRRPGRRAAPCRTGRPRARCSRPATCSTAARGWPSGWPGSADFLADAPRRRPAGHPRRARDAAGDFTAVDAFRAQHRLQELRRRGPTGSGSDVDVLLLPTVPTTFTRAEIAADPIGPQPRARPLHPVRQPARPRRRRRPDRVHRRRAPGRRHPARPRVLRGTACRRRPTSSTRRGGRMTHRPEHRTKARIGPVAANPYPWPYDGVGRRRDGRADLHRLAGRLLRPRRLRRPRWATTSALTRAGLPATAATARARPRASACS